MKRRRSAEVRARKIAENAVGQYVEIRTDKNTKFGGRIRSANVDGWKTTLSGGVVIFRVLLETKDGRPINREFYVRQLPTGSAEGRA